MEQDKKTVGRFPMDRFIKDVRNGREERSRFMKRAGKMLLAIVGIVTVTGLLCLAQYTIYPMKTDFTRTTSGYLVNKQGEELIYTKVTAKIQGSWQHYLFRTEKESTTCEVYVDGYDVTQGGISVAHDEKKNAGKAVENMNEEIKDHIKLFYMTRKCETVILGIENAVSIPGNELPETSKSTMTLLVISADTKVEAQAVVKEAAEDSSQLQKWVNRYGFL